MQCLKNNLISETKINPSLSQSKNSKINLIFYSRGSKNNLTIPLIKSFYVKKS